MSQELSEMPSYGEMPDSPNEGVAAMNTPPQQEGYPQSYSEDLDLRVEQEREFFRQKKLLADKERELSLKEASMSKPKSVDDYLDEMFKEGETEEKEEAPMSHEEIIAEAKRQIREELENEANEHYEQEEISANIERFNEDVQNFLSESEDEFPLSNAFGLSQKITEDVLEELEGLAEEYGEDYAQKWLNELDWGEVAYQYENNVANDFKAMLQSPKVRQVISSFLGVRDQMPSGEPPRTLRQDDLGMRSTGNSIENMSEEQRVAFAKAQMRKHFLENASNNKF
ncbi:MAG: hypothetical protein ACO2ZP_09010 [Bacteriovoracaceae bacterium]